MEIKSHFTVPLTVDQAWLVLLDATRIAPCLPGARLIEVQGQNRYKGEMEVRLGPVALKFAGRAEIIDIDAVAHCARIKAEGTDAKGRGAAVADLRFALAPESGETGVSIISSINLSGAVAQYGRGTGMINDLANHLVTQFATNLRRELQGELANSTSGTVTPVVESNAIAPPLRAERVGFLLVWRALIRALRRWVGLAG